MPTITGTSTLAECTPELIFPWATTQTGGNIMQDIIGSPYPWVSLSAARSRQGSLVAFFPSEADAEAARVMLSSPESFTIDYPARPSIEMTFVIDSGGIAVELDAETQDHWTVRFDFREIG